MNAKKLVLIVDDEQGILNFAKAKLSLAGYEVITTTQGEDALRLAAANNPDLVILDILMVPVSGLDILSDLRKSSQVPVIVFTGHGPVAQQALKLGANDFIAKPFNPDDLIVKVNNQIGR